MAAGDSVSRQISAVGWWSPAWASSRRSGNDVESFWKSITEGRSGIGPITRFDASAMRTRIAGGGQGLRPRGLLRPQGHSPTRPHQPVFPDRRPRGDVPGWYRLPAPMTRRPPEPGVVFGGGFGGMESFIDEIRTLDRRGPDRVSPTGIPKIIVNISAGLVSIEHNLLGPGLVRRNRLFGIGQRHR